VRRCRGDESSLCEMQGELDKSGESC